MNAQSRSLPKWDNHHFNSYLFATYNRSQIHREMFILCCSRFIEHLVEHMCRFATVPAKAESDFNIQTSQITGVVSELRTVSDDAIEHSVKFAEEQEGRENTEYDLNYASLNLQIYLL